MTKYVYVQIRDAEKQAKIQADKAETSGNMGAPGYKLILSLKNEEVGQFNGNVVDGWWIQNE